MRMAVLVGVVGLRHQLVPVEDIFARAIICPLCQFGHFQGLGILMVTFDAGR